jgi:hypothetical protein
MSTLRTWIAPLSALAALCVGFVPAIAGASSHREAPAVSYDPAADNTDLYAWVNAGAHDKLNVVANWNPLEEPAGGPNFNEFSDDVRYEIYVSRGKSNNAVVSYYIEFTTTDAPQVDVANLGLQPGGGKEFFSQLSGQKRTYKITKVLADGKKEVIVKAGNVAPNDIGPDTNAFFDRTYDDAFAAGFITPTTDGGRAWAGPRDDGFYVDLGGIFDLANLRPAGEAQDGVAGFNTHSIVLEIPTTVVAKDKKIPAMSSIDSIIGVWTATSRRKITIRRFGGKTKNYGPWVQVSRLGHPLINEAVIGIQDKDKYNATHPADDLKNFAAYVLNPIIVRDAIAVGIYSDADAADFKSNRTDIVTALNLGNPDVVFADVLRIDLSADPGYPNGRPIPGGGAPNKEQADVTDVLLSVLLTKQLSGISDGVDYNDKDFLPSMPWLALPHSGFDGGHGIPTPPMP